MKEKEKKGLAAREKVGAIARTAKGTSKKRGKKRVEKRGGGWDRKRVYVVAKWRAKEVGTS